MLISDKSFFDDFLRNDQSTYVKRKGFSHLPVTPDLYFVGIGGVGMSSVARLLKNRGYGVSGSDKLASLSTSALNDIGIKINFQQNVTTVFGMNNGYVIVLISFPYPIIG